MAVIVFDADDTLWQNEWQYSRAQAEFFAYLYKVFGHYMPNLHYVKDVYFRLDGECFKTWGIKRGRVAHSMLLCYGEVSKWVAWRFGHTFRDSEIRKHHRVIKKIGDTPFDFSKLQWRRDALPTLLELKEKGHILCLLSSYDEEWFAERVRYMDAGRFFDKRYIRSTNLKKTKQDFIAVSEWTPEMNETYAWYAVGNSASDIMPALEISEKWKGFYMPHGSTSKYLEHGKEPNNYPEPLCHFMPPSIDDPRVTTVHTLHEIFRVLHRNYGYCE